MVLIFDSIVDIISSSADVVVENVVVASNFNAVVTLSSEIVDLLDTIVIHG